MVHASSGAGLAARWARAGTRPHDPHSSVTRGSLCSSVRAELTVWCLSLAAVGNLHGSGPPPTPHTGPHVDSTKWLDSSQQLRCTFLFGLHNHFDCQPACAGV